MIIEEDFVQNDNKIIQHIKELFEINDTQINSLQEYVKMITDHKTLFDTQNFIFNRAVSGELDPTVFSYMITKAKDIKRNKISNHDASKDVGQKLVDTFIKPNLKK